jgi:hypothetical protein
VTEDEAHQLAEVAFSDVEPCPEVWIARPSYSVASHLQRAAAATAASRSLPRQLYERYVEGSTVRRLSISLSGRELHVASTLNQERTLAPLLPDSFRRVRRTLVVPRSASSELHDIGLTVMSKLADLGIRDGTVVDRLARARRTLNLARRIVDSTRPNVLVVANQHSLPSRAFLLAARERDVPAAYVNHAPTAPNAAGLDLPVTRAGLRGSREVDLFSSIGVRSDRIDVVGATSIDLPDRSCHDPAGDVVLALGPDPVDFQRRIIDMVWDAGLREVVVAPHPSVDPERIRFALHSGWRFNTLATTRALLSRGAAALIQRSSGVAWEALRLGIPVIEVRNDEAEPTTPIVREPYVRIARSSDDLGVAVSSPPSPSQLAAGVDWAREWCDLTGHRAVTAARHLIERTAESPPAWIYDAWAFTG